MEAAQGFQVKNETKVPSVEELKLAANSLQLVQSIAEHKESIQKLDSKVMAAQSKRSLDPVVDGNLPPKPPAASKPSFIVRPNVRLRSSSDEKSNARKPSSASKRTARLRNIIQDVRDEEFLS